MARNRISNIQPSLSNSIPNLTTLVLTANHLAELADLDPLSGFRRLTHLVLMENPVTRKEVSILPFDTLISEQCYGWHGKGKSCVGAGLG